jgi:DNA-binding GntR family transcriptional regulator
MPPRAAHFVRPPTLTATVVDHIREALVRGQLLPGAPLHEVDLSTSLGVSRGTVREALRRLHEENLVEIVPHQGAFVTKLSARKAWEIYTLRGQLEPYAVRLAMERRAYRAQDVNELDILVRRLGDLERNGDLSEIIATDLEFHRVICEPSGHALVMDMLRSLRFQTRLFILNTILYHSDLERDDVTHRAILDAVRAGDPARAEESMRKHINDAGTWLIRRMEAQETGLPADRERHPSLPTRAEAGAVLASFKRRSGRKRA